MKKSTRGGLLAAVVAACAGVVMHGCGSGAAQTGEPSAAPGARTPASHDERMAWWRDARFGMFIHWGLYAIPAGKWGSRTDHGEWIMTTAQIPVEEYETLRDRFNPVKFDADAWARAAADAGMKYIVITSKHHDGFCLFDSAHTDYDVMSTPWQRDIMRELSDACARHGLVMCWYHSIMDWHHPDYLPRRTWETRSAEGADLDRFNAYVKAQVEELLTNYGPIGVMWFDGEWEETWTHERGVDLFEHVRRISPATIVNNRVDKGRDGMAGLSLGPQFKGDFETPEQEIPAGAVGRDWETCMTMNNHWGYNEADRDYKSSRDLLRKLADIASKGGNFLLNIGPTAEGEFPPESLARLAEIGAWMKTNGEAIYGTAASPFEAGSLTWGRCTQKRTDGGARLYLHVFDWPTDGRLRIGAIENTPVSASLLADGSPLEVSRDGDAIVVSLPPSAPDANNSVVTLDIRGTPVVHRAPAIAPATGTDIFLDRLDVALSTDHPSAIVRYTTDGSDPTARSHAGRTVMLRHTATVKARLFAGDRPLSGVSQAEFTRVEPRSNQRVPGAVAGLSMDHFEGEWSRLPDLSALTPARQEVVTAVTLGDDAGERFARRYRGYIMAPARGLYRFHLTSDDGSRLRIGGQTLIDNDGLHVATTRDGVVALGPGLHAIEVEVFNRTGKHALKLEWEGPGVERREPRAGELWHAPNR